MMAMRMMTIVFAAAALASGGGAVAQATDPGGAAAPPVAADSVPGYVLGPHDVINVMVVGRTDYTTQAQVQEDGTIALPLIGSITVANMTLLQLKAAIEQRLRSGGYFVRPEVAVALVTATNQYATLLGDIGTPGLVPLDRRYRLSDLIARSGGVKPGADAVTLTLPNGGTRIASLRAIATGASPDPLIEPGTKIFVQPAQIFYIYGQVGSSGSFPLDAGMTVRNALARAGGLSALGSSRKVTIYRGEQVFKKVNMNMKLQAGDTIKVGERFF